MVIARALPVLRDSGVSRLEGDADCYWPRALLYLRGSDTYQSASKAGFRFGELVTELARGNEQRDSTGVLIDLTHRQPDWGPPRLVAERILNACASLELMPAMGMAVNRYHARYASTLAAPAGLRLLPPWALPRELIAMPISQLLNLPLQQGHELQRRGITSCGDLMLAEPAGLSPALRELRELCAGRIEAAYPRRSREQLDVELVLPPNTRNHSTLRRYLLRALQSLQRHLGRHLLRPAACRLELHGAVTRCCTGIDIAMDSGTEPGLAIKQLLGEWGENDAVTRVTLVARGLQHRYGQLDLFGAAQAV